MPARVLIVDDEPPSARMLAAKLNGEYYDVLTAEDGPGALEAVRQQDPDLILLDVMLPGMDGYEVCRKIKQDPSTAHIPIVIVSALDERAHRVRGIEAGAEEFLTKPVDDITLFARIRSLVRLKQTLDQWRLRGETTQKMGFPNDDEMVAVDDGLLGGEERLEDPVPVLCGDPGAVVAHPDPRKALLFPGLIMRHQN